MACSGGIREEKNLRASNKGMNRRKCRNGLGAVEQNLSERVQVGGAERNPEAHTVHDLEQLVSAGRGAGREFQSHRPMRIAQCLRCILDGRKFHLGNQVRLPDGRDSGPRRLVDNGRGQRRIGNSGKGEGGGRGVRGREGAEEDGS
eukprot:763317-Hanusia_phi.AAC.6